MDAGAMAKGETSKAPFFVSNFTFVPAVALMSTIRPGTFINSGGPAVGVSSQGRYTKLGPLAEERDQSFVPTRSPGRGCQSRRPSSSPPLTESFPSQAEGVVSTTPKRTRSEMTRSSVSAEVFDWDKAD